MQKHECSTAFNIMSLLFVSQHPRSQVSTMAESTPQDSCRVPTRWSLFFSSFLFTSHFEARLLFFTLFLWEQFDVLWNKTSLKHKLTRGLQMSIVTNILCFGGMFSGLVRWDENLMWYKICYVLCCLVYLDVGRRLMLVTQRTLSQVWSTEVAASCCGVVCCTRNRCSL